MQVLCIGICYYPMRCLVNNNGAYWVFMDSYAGGLIKFVILDVNPY